MSWLVSTKKTPSLTALRLVWSNCVSLALQAVKTTPHGGNGAIWKACCGGNRSGRTLRVCAGHEGCQVHLVIDELEPSKWYVSVTSAVAHKLIESKYRRSNSALTTDQVSICICPYHMHIVHVSAGISVVSSKCIICVSVRLRAVSGMYPPRICWA